MITIQLVKNLRITGLVQGVGFRDAMVVEANRVGARGWVRNRSDGSVEAVVAGNEEHVQAMLAWARRGPRGARVYHVAVSELTSPGIEIGRFGLRPTV